MLKPQFLLTKKIPLTIFRGTQGQLVKGRWVAGIPTSITREVNIQPLKPYEVLQLPEVDRTNQWYKLYCAEDLKTLMEGDGGWPADEFEWEGYRYIIKKTETWSMGILNHVKAQACRIGPTPGVTI